MLTNCGENPCNTPVKKLISNKVDTLLLQKGHEPTTGLIGDAVFKTTIFCSVLLIMFPFCQKNTNLNFFVFRGY